MIRVRLFMHGVVTTTNNEFNTPTSLINEGCDCPRQLFAIIKSYTVLRTETVTPTIEGVPVSAVVEFDLPGFDEIPSINGFDYWSHYNLVHTSGDDRIESIINNISIQEVKSLLD